MASSTKSRRFAAPSLALALALTGCSSGDDSPAVIPALVLDVPAGVQTTEAGTQATFTVALDHRPSQDLTLAVASSDPSEGTVTTASLVFTADHWNAPQRIVVTGVDDDVADGLRPYAILLGLSVSDAVLHSEPTADVVISLASDDEGEGTIDAASLTFTSLNWNAPPLRRARVHAALTPTTARRRLDTARGGRVGRPDRGPRPATPRRRSSGRA